MPLRNAFFQTGNVPFLLCNAPFSDGKALSHRHRQSFAPCRHAKRHNNSQQYATFIPVEAAHKHIRDKEQRACCGDERYHCVAWLTETSRHATVPDDKQDRYCRVRQCMPKMGTPQRYVQSSPSANGLNKQLDDEHGYRNAEGYT